MHVCVCCTNIRTVYREMLKDTEHPHTTEHPHHVIFRTGYIYMYMMYVRKHTPLICNRSPQEKTTILDTCMYLRVMQHTNASFVRKYVLYTTQKHLM